MRSTNRSSILLAVMLASVAAAGCAPDSWSNRQATGYNAFLNTIATSCNPLMLGDANVSEWIQNNGANNFNYSYFLDMTSKLYYGNITPAAYRETDRVPPSTSVTASSGNTNPSSVPRSIELVVGLRSFYPATTGSTSV